MVRIARTGASPGGLRTLGGGLPAGRSATGTSPRSWPATSRGLVPVSPHRSDRRVAFVADRAATVLLMPHAEPPPGAAADRWRDDLAAWAIPQPILDAAPESPWHFPVELFARRADAARSRLSPSNLR